jgi:hypothetical protein
VYLAPRDLRVFAAFNLLQAPPVAQNLVDNRHLTADLENIPARSHAQLRNDFAIEPVAGRQGKRLAFRSERDALVATGQFIGKEMKETRRGIICQEGEIGQRRQRTLLTIRG